MKKDIRCENLVKTFGAGQTAVHALRDVSLRIGSGEFVSVCGPSGSGKTTFLNMVGGLDTPDSGRVLFDDLAISELSESARAKLRLESIGFIFQAYNLIPVFSAAENVEFIMQLQGQPRKKSRTRAEEMLSAVGLDGLGNRRPKELSGGQQQRVAVARALAAEPQVILADEPTANLDSETAENLLQLMVHMNEERGVTFLFSTHDKLVMSYAKRIITLADGEVTEDTG